MDSYSGKKRPNLKKGDIIYLKNIIGSDFILYQSGVVTEVGLRTDIDTRYAKIKLTDPEQELGKEVIIFETKYDGSAPFYDGHDNDYAVDVIAEGSK